MKKIKHLRLDLWGLYNSGSNKHAQDVMNELGITYQYAVPQSLGDQWWFFNVENIPNNLPDYFSELKVEDPKKLIGYGLSEEMAINIENYEKD